MSKKLSKKRSLSSDDIKELVRSHRHDMENEKDTCKDYLFFTPIIGGIGAGIGAFVGCLTWYCCRVSWRISQIKEKSYEINAEILKVAQEKANLFNEKFGRNIPVPDSNQMFSTNVDDSSSTQLLSATSDSIEQVRGSVTNLIDEHMVNYVAGKTHGEMHIYGFAHGHGYVDGTDGEILIEPGFEQYVFDLQKFYRDELGDGLDNQLVDIVNTISPAKDDLLNSTLIGLGIGCVPGAVCLVLAGIHCGRMLYHKKKLKQYQKEYDEMEQL